MSQNDFRELTDIKRIALDNSKLPYYEHYFEEYYNDAFRPHQGTERILDVLRQYQVEGSWLDLGSGPATLFWGLMLKRPSELTCTEIAPEGLKVLDDFISSNQIPQCYRDVMGMYRIPAEHLRRLRQIPRRYVLFDALRPWPAQAVKKPFDLLTAFGVFGLCLSGQHYQDCFSYLRPAVRPGGVAIGANWIRSQHFIDQGNSDNRYLRPELVRAGAERAGFKVLHASQELISGDPNYTGVVIWALQP